MLGSIFTKTRLAFGLALAAGFGLPAAASNCSKSTALFVTALEARRQANFIVCTVIAAHNGGCLAVSGIQLRWETDNFPVVFRGCPSSRTHFWYINDPNNDNWGDVSVDNAACDALTGYTHT